MKSQALVLQFLLFFVIGLSVFSLVTGVFDFYANNFRKTNQENAMRIVCNYLAVEAINFESCSICQVANLSITLPEKMLGNAYKLSSVNNELVCESLRIVSVNDKINNLNKIYTISSNIYSVAKNKIFSIDKIQNYLRVVVA